jgi:two-component system sensor histidine kinase SenX3
VIDAVDGGAPASWVGKKTAELVEAPPAMRQAAAELLAVPTTSNVRRSKVRTDDVGGALEIEVLLVEALPLRRAPTPLSALTMRTLDFFASQAEACKVDLTVEQVEGVPMTVVLDGEKIAWALSTLIANALRYARKHVGVRVSWDAGAAELVIDVSDDGPGIPEENRRWLFERHPSSGHTAGLALPMVRDVMAAHRGSVTVRNLPPPRGGAVFSLRLPHVS